MTIRLDASFKARLVAAARRSGKTPHAFILDAISQNVDRVEREDELERLAEKRWAKLRTTGKTTSWEAATTYLRAKGRGERPRRPVARSSRR